MKIVFLSDCWIKKEAENPDLLPPDKKRFVALNTWFKIDKLEIYQITHYRFWVKEEVWLVYRPYVRIEEDYA